MTGWRRCRFRDTYLDYGEAWVAIPAVAGDQGTGPRWENAPLAPDRTGARLSARPWIAVYQPQSTEEGPITIIDQIRPTPLDNHWICCMSRAGIEPG
ncbi:MAG: hypothetical protein R3E79_02825 [Caldilineaceae bacterium]